MDWNNHYCEHTKNNAQLTTNKGKWKKGGNGKEKIVHLTYNLQLPTSNIQHTTFYEGKNRYEKEKRVQICSYH